MNMRKYFLFGTVFLVSVVLLDYVKVRVNNKIEFVDKISQRKFTSYFLYPSEEARDKPTRHVALVKAHKVSGSNEKIMIFGYFRRKKTAFPQKSCCSENIKWPKLFEEVKLATKRPSRKKCQK